MKLATIIAAVAAVLAAASPASAQGLASPASDDGWYIAGFVGAGFPEDAEFTGVQSPVPGIPSPASVDGAPAAVDVGFDTDVYFGGAVGYRLPIKFLGLFQTRLEAEVSYLETDVSGGSFNGGTQTFGGDQEILFFLLNNFADIRWSDDQRFVPYLGGGLGAAIVDTNVAYFPATADAPVFGLTEQDVAFAGTAAIGASYELTPSLELYGEGRYYRIYNVQTERTFIAGGADLFNAEVEDDIDGFTATGGLRFRF